MNHSEQLTAALLDLEADLGNYRIPDAQLITVREDSPQEELREVYRAIMGLDRRVPVYSNDFDQHKIPNTGHVVTKINLTGMVYIETIVGKLVLPHGTNLSIMGKF